MLITPNNENIKPCFLLRKRLKLKKNSKNSSCFSRDYYI